jgi:hypothetical protein
MKTNTRIKLSALLILFSLIYDISIAGKYDSLEQILDEMPVLGYNRMGSDTTFSEKYEVFISQPLDHNDPEAGSFPQRFFICHKGYDRPVVFVTEGYGADYGIHSEYKSELGTLLGANEIVVEHRFFSLSKPDSIDWKYLTVANAAADHHRIIELMKEIYNKTKWITTGISKGGQTALFHRTFYPEDVDATLAYVAPLNFSDEDLRVYDFLENVGTAECRARIFEFQKMVLENRDESLKAFEKAAKGKGLTYSVGLEEAFELMVLEYSFAFWQWGTTPCEEGSIPGEKSRAKEWIEHIDEVAGLDWVSDQGIKRVQPFFYQAMTEIGMYGYDLEPFGDLIIALKDNKFSFTCPEGCNCSYNPETMEKVDYYVRHEAENIMLIYGEWDAWSATAVQWSGIPGVIKIVKPEGSHRTRIRNLPEEQRRHAVNTLREWMDLN